MKSPLLNKLKLSPGLGARLLAFILLCTIAYAFVWLGSHWHTLSQRIDSNFLALLPKSEQSPYIEKAIQKIAQDNEDVIVLLIGHSDIDMAIRAADLLKQKMTNLPVSLKEDALAFPRNTSGESQPNATQHAQDTLAFYAPYKKNLLSNADLQLLNLALTDPPSHSLLETTTQLGERTKIKAHGTEQRNSIYKYSEEASTTQRRDWGGQPVVQQSLLDRAYAKAYSMMGIGSSWKEDPFGLFDNWLLNLSQFSKVRPVDGHLMVTDQEKKYIFLAYQTHSHALSTAWLEKFSQDLSHTLTAVQQEVPNTLILKAGVSLHAAAATQQANQESLLIGILSALGGALLIGLVFRKLYALGLVVITVALAFILAFTTTLLFFPKIYLLTIVFGTTLIGMSIDYCLYWLSSSIEATSPPLLRAPYTTRRTHQDQGVRNEVTRQYICVRRGNEYRTTQRLECTASCARGSLRRRQLLPGMSLALLTTACGYLLLAATPFPVFTQMAVFSLAGIIAAWLIVMLWFPLLTRLQFKENAFIHLFSKIEPGLIKHARAKQCALVLLIISALYGITSVKTNDDIRHLITPDKTLLSEQIALQTLLDQPSPAQFYLVTGQSPEEVLQRTEALTIELDKIIQQGLLSGYQSITQWLPSIARQQHIIDLRHSTTYHKITRQLEQTLELGHALNHDKPDEEPLLTFEKWQHAPFAAALNFLWFQLPDGKFATTVLLRGVHGSASTTALSRLEASVPLANQSILWVDKPSEISHVFETYRKKFSWIVGLAYLLTFVLLSLRYGVQAWRAVFPPLLASALVMTIFSLIGEPFSLLSILALALVLGVGTDYGIFILEYPQNKRMVLSISIGALMTIITFGSLALSATPALHNFGLTLCLGVAFSWFLTLFFAKSTNQTLINR